MYGKKWNVRMVTVVLLCFILLLAGCSSGGKTNNQSNQGQQGQQNQQGQQGQSQGDKQEKVKVRVGYVQLAITFPFQAAIERGLFEQNGIEIEAYPYADFGALYTAFQSGDLDMGVTVGPASIVDLRAKGVPIKMLFVDSILSNELLVAADSPIKDFSELKGKRIGLFGGAAGTSANIFMTIAKSFYGFDPQTEATVEYGAPGLLANLVSTGELDAFLSTDPVTSIEMTAGKVKSIGELSTIHNAEKGFHISGSGMVAMDSFAEKNKEVVEKMIDIWFEGVDLLDDPNMWLELAKKYMQLEDPAVVAKLQERIGPTFNREWTAAHIERDIGVMEFIKSYAGEGFLENIDVEAFSRDFLFDKK